MKYCTKCGSEMGVVGTAKLEITALYEAGYKKIDLDLCPPCYKKLKVHLKIEKPDVTLAFVDYTVKLAEEYDSQEKYISKISEDVDLDLRDIMFFKGIWQGVLKRRESNE